jgi:aromatic O-demethylase, cytochrome P450 subunit
MSTKASSIATDIVVDARLEEIEADPYPLYRQMRRETPIAWVPETEQLWITPYELCREAGDNDRVFGPTQDVFHLVYGNPNVMSLMGTEHKESRAPLDARFRPRAVSGYVDSILRETTVRHIEEIREHGAADINTDLLEPIALRSVGEVMGFADVDDETLSRWFNALGAYLVDRGRDEEITARGEAIKDEICEYMTSRLDQIRRGEDETTLTMMFTHGMPEGEVRSVGDVIGNVGLMMVGGFQEPAHGTANALYGLLGRPELAAAVAAEPAKLAMQAEQEGLRWIAPFNMTEKLTTEDVELGGLLIPAGTEIALCLGSANRDERVFENPDTYDLFRERTRAHVSFGYGEHLCVGHYVARQLGKVCIEEIFFRLPNLRLDPDREPVVHGWAVRAAKRLPVLWDA